LLAIKSAPQATWLPRCNLEGKLLPGKNLAARGVWTAEVYFCTGVRLAEVHCWVGETATEPLVVGECARKDSTIQNECGTQDPQQFYHMCGSHRKLLLTNRFSPETFANKPVLTGNFC